jgi:hypothetical protein
MQWRKFGKYISVIPAKALTFTHKSWRYFFTHKSWRYFPLCPLAGEG